MAVLTTAAPATLTSREIYCRRVLIGIAVFAALGLAGHLAMILWSQHEFTPVEPLVAIHANMLMHGGGLYYALNHYPFTVSCYGPIFYVLSGFLHKAGLGAYLSGRIVSFAALLTTLWLSWKALGFLTRDPYARASGVILTACTSNLLFWGTAGQTDILACCFSLGAFTVFLRYRETRETRLLVWSGVLVILAGFTKQTALAGGAAIAVTLLLENRKRCALWVAAVGLAAGASALGLNAITHGGYFSDAILANINPFAWFKLEQQARYLVLTGAGVIVTAAVGAWRASRHTLPAYLYAGFATAMWIVTAPKIGSDLNYQVEMMLALPICAACALSELHFFQNVFAGTRSPVTLLQMPLLLYVVLNILLTGRVLAERALLEPVRSQETEALKPYLDAPGRVLSVHYDSLVHYRERIDVEPLMYSWLVKSGVVDQDPVLQDLSARRFAAVLLTENLFEPEPASQDPEIARLPEAQQNAIRQNYRLVQHVDGPYGIYVYQPKPN